MKSKRFIIPALVALGLMLLISPYCLAVETPSESAEAYYHKGVEHGTQGKFKEAKEEFERALKADRFYWLAKEWLKLTKDAISQKIKRRQPFICSAGRSIRIRGCLMRQSRTLIRP